MCRNRHGFCFLRRDKLLLISFELFGFDHAYYYLIAIAVSYMLSGYYSLYHAQTIVYSKFENSYVNRHGE